MRKGFLTVFVQCKQCETGVINRQMIRNQAAMLNAFRGFLLDSIL